MDVARRRGLRAPRGIGRPAWGIALLLAGVGIVGSATVDRAAAQGPPEWPAGAELEVTDLGPTSVSLAWPPAIGVRDRDAYLLFVTSDDCDRDDREVNCTHLSTYPRRAPFGGAGDLEPGRQYIFWIKACNESACSSGRTDPSVIVTTPLPVGFELSTPTRMDVVRQDFATATVEIGVDTGRNQGPESVTLAVAGLPALGASAEFEPVEGVPPFSSTLRISASANTPLGPHRLIVTASGGGQQRTSTIDLDVSDEPPASSSTTLLPVGFELSSPARIDVVRQDFVTAMIEIDVDATSNEGPGSVRLALDGLPAVGAIAEFEPADGVPPFSSTLRISASANTPLGPHRLIVTASGGGQERTSTIDLTVAEQPGDGFDLFGAGQEIVVGVVVIVLGAVVLGAGRRIRGHREPTAR